MQRKHINIGAIIIAFSYSIMSASDKQKIMSQAIKPMVTLQAANGSREQIQHSAIKYSRVLMRAGRAQNGTISVGACTNKYELYALFRVLNTIDIAAKEGRSKPEVIDELRRYYINNATVAAGVGNFFKIPLMQKVVHVAEQSCMAAHCVVDDVGAKKAYKEILHEAVISGCDAYGKPLTVLQKAGLACRIAYLNRKEQEAKKNYLASKGAIRMPFFMGVSVGELIDNQLADFHYRHSGERVVDAPHPCSLLNADITSIEGLRCEHRAGSTSNKERRVMITGVRIRTLPAQAFAQTNNPTWISLRSNSIEEIDPEVFVGAEKVAMIDLSGNQLRTLPTEVFNPLKQLVSINISQNPLVSISSEQFKHCSALRYISLIDTHIPQEQLKALRDALSPQVWVHFLEHVTPKIE